MIKIEEMCKIWKEITKPREEKYKEFFELYRTFLKVVPLDVRKKMGRQIESNVASDYTGGDFAVYSNALTNGYNEENARLQAGFILDSSQTLSTASKCYPIKGNVTRAIEFTMKDLFMWKRYIKEKKPTLLPIEKIKEQIEKLFLELIFEQDIEETGFETDKIFDLFDSVFGDKKKAKKTKKEK